MASGHSSTTPELIKAHFGLLLKGMADFKTNVEAFDNKSKSGVPIALQKLLTQYCKSIFQFTDSYKVSNGRVSKAAKLSVEKLRQNLIKFEGQHSTLKKKTKITPKLNKIICDLIGDVQWFVDQYDMTINSYPLTANVPIGGTAKDWALFIKTETEALKGSFDKKIIPNRPKNWDIREVFRRLTTKHQKEFGPNKYVRYKVFINELDKINKQAGTKFTLSARSYYLYKKSWKERTFNSVV